MRPKQPQWLLHPLFLSSLSLLLLNDISLKYVFHNELTGKLSDFTGMIVLPMFLFAFLPTRKNTILLVSGFLFCFWKSSLSEPLIQFINNIQPFVIARVVDYTDLLALCMLPLLYFVKERTHFAQPIQAAFLIRFICIISIFAFCNTSMIRNSLYTRPAGETSLNKDFYTQKPLDQILNNLDADGQGWTKDTAKFYELGIHNDYYYVIRNADSTLYWQKLANNRDTMLYVGMNESSFYTIKSLKVNEYNLRDIRLRFTAEKKKNRVTITTFNFQPTKGQESYLTPKEIRKVKRYLGKLIYQTTE